MSTPTQAEMLPRTDDEYESEALQGEQQNTPLQLRGEVETANARVRELEAQVESLRTQLSDSLKNLAHLTVRVRHSDGSGTRYLRAMTRETSIRFSIPVGRLEPADNVEVEVEVVVRNIADTTREA